MRETSAPEISTEERPKIINQNFKLQYPSSRSRVNGIVTEITSRATIYRKQDAFVLFTIFDPQRHIVNDEQFKVDCSGQDGVWVEVLR